ncbi:MAG TPA: serine/threonine-protein kinase, partial [Candidatus Krumholzibacteria bacterium]|nr:serine/threonine-protein kinase [Candidatus Krumholzibacteria bacterium]
MDAERSARVSDLFDHAKELPPAERDAFLARECAGDTELLHEVRSLLDHHVDEPESRFIGWNANHAPAVDDEIKPGDVVQRFRIARTIGEGGMGIVYLAEQSSPVRRKVALKIVRVGMDTKELLARFEAERQALAMMDHPAIARIYDAGATERGRPYFAMEYVDGVPITEYCDQRRLDVTSRLRLFADVCNAIHHAHQRGIIHRDIKPTNVLVTEYEGKPAPKVIDFGIARATDQSLAAETMHTRRDVMLGTPAYMSPEQADPMEPPDTRTDVYSLGALLYQLLTGRPPLEFGERQTVESIRRTIIDTDPPRPSARLTSLGEKAAAVAAERRTDAKHLLSLLRNDVDWIVMRALEKDRARRYGSASELAADIQRFLDREPVVARPPTVGYRVRKYARRHRYLMAGATAVFVVLVAGLTATIWQAREARQRTRELEAIAARLVSHFYELSDYPGAMAAKQTLAELATQTLDDLTKRGGDDPSVRRQLASAYEGLGQLLGDNYSASLGQSAAAVVARKKALDIREELHRANPADFGLANEYLKSYAAWGMLALFGYLDEVGIPGVAWHPEVIPTAQQRRDRKMILSLSDDVASERAWFLGRTDSMVFYIERARARREALLAEEPGNLEYQRLLADTYDRLAYLTRDVDEAERLARRAVEFCENYYRAHPFSWKASMDVAYTRRNLGYARWRKGDLAGGLEEQRLGLEARRRLASADSMNVRGTFLLSEGYSLVGQAFLRMGRPDSSIHYSRQALGLLYELAKSPNPPDWTGNELAFVHTYLANAHQDRNDAES